MTIAPNYRASLDAAIAFCLHSGALWRRASEHGRSANPRRMSFTRPYWFLMFISLGCLVLGFADWMLVTPDFKGEPDLRLWVFAASYVLAGFGVVGFISSLIWMLVSGVGSRQAKR
ncbi:MAG TPA: hypothetical protein VMU04_18830 [Candidatus Acidoferrum sp.]|nr:hypothetical protein [Candidatus Acidoferrum sp.]